MQLAKYLEVNAGIPDGKLTIRLAFNVFPAGKVIVFLNVIISPIPIFGATIS